MKVVDTHMPGHQAVILNKDEIERFTNLYHALIKGTSEHPIDRLVAASDVGRLVESFTGEHP